MIEYTYDVQKLFLEMMMHDAQSFLRVQNIYMNKKIMKTLSLDHQSIHGTYNNNINQILIKLNA